MSDQPRGVAYPLFERVNAERAEKGWTWTRLRERSGVARSTISNWQTNQATPRPDTVNAVADALGIPRLAALKLGGVVTELIPDDAPLCTFEESILGEPSISEDSKAQLIRTHRAGGHSNCRPLDTATAGGERLARL